MSKSAISSRHITFMLMSLGILSSAVIFGTMFWLSERINALDEARTRDLISVKLAATQSALERAALDYAHWTAAYTVVIEGDDDAIYDNLGSGAVEGALFDHLFILDNSATELYRFEKPDSAPGIDFLQSRAVQDALTALRETAPEEFNTVTGLVYYKGAMAAMSLAWITPDDLDLLSHRPAPILVSLVSLGETYLHRLETFTGILGVSIQDAPPRAGMDAIAIGGGIGAPRGYINWEKPQSGTVLMRQVLPGILITCIAILGVCISAARYFHVQSTGYARATWLAQTDQLTGVLNRAGLQTVIEDPDFKRDLAAGHLAVMYIDLNKFKALNDTHGHDVGDVALQTLANWLTGSVRRADHVVRLGGDEFLCIIVDETPERAVRVISERLQQAIQQPLPHAPSNVFISASIGISIADPGASWTSLLEQSDHAMYRAKRAQMLTPNFHQEDLPRTA
jgi:diguanylate cyclase (GGDEF)-like protein